MATKNKIVRFVTTDIWRKSDIELKGWHRLVHGTVKALLVAVKGFGKNELSMRANALTYSMLFAIIPILAMIVAITKGFGFDSVIEEKLTQSFIGQTDMVPTIMGFIDRYLETAQGGVFIGIGLVVLLWSVWSFFSNIELAFNRIWQVEKNRNPLKQITTYLAVLILVPIMIVVTSGLSIFLNTMVEKVVIVEEVWWMKDVMVKFIPFVACWLVFTLLYWAVPNTKVRFISAFIPGVLAGSLYQGLQMLSMYLLVFLSRTSIIYGAFAALPLILTWLQLVFLFTLIGAELSFAIQNHEQFSYEQDINKMSRRYKDFITLFIMALIVKEFKKEDGIPMTAHQIAVMQNIPTRLVNQLTSRLEEVGILREVYVEGVEERTFQPAMDVRLLTVGAVIRRISKQGVERFLSNPTPERDELWKRWSELSEKPNELDNLPIENLIP